MFKKLPLVLLIFSLSACTRGQAVLPTPTAVPDLDAEQQAVYAALIKSMVPAAEMVVVMDTTATDLGGVGNLDQTLLDVMKQMKGVASETADSFRVRNAAAQVLKVDMNLGLPYNLLSEADRRLIFNINQDGWQEFYNRYPNASGIITLSNVGFNLTATQALVYFGNQSNWLAGAGYYVLLKKTNGVWVMEQQVMTWIS